MSDNKWKKFLLKSGLPFEHEIKECLEANGCQPGDEYPYLRHDETGQLKEFSYDIDAHYFKGGVVNFMIECKYKTEPTKWFFMPDPNVWQDELHQNSFLNPIDYFKDRKFLYNDHPYCTVLDELGPFCLKGIEIRQDGFIESTIERAICQLAYAFVDKVIASVADQIEDGYFKNQTHFNVPIIVTNAELQIINEKLTTKDIERAESIEEVSTKHDFLLYHNKFSNTLARHNQVALTEYFSNVSDETFAAKNKSFAKNKAHFIEIVSKNYCPAVILIMHHDESQNNFRKLFSYIDSLLVPTPEVKARTEEVINDWNSRIEKFGAKLNPPR